MQPNLEAGPQSDHWLGSGCARFIISDDREGETVAMNGGVDVFDDAGGARDDWG
jgi:hypothetical protein